MSFHPIMKLLGGHSQEESPLIHQENENETAHEGRCWRFAKDLFRVSRRYSVVASEVSLLALNILFLIAKVDKNASEQLGEDVLAMLSTLGVISLHYYGDVVWKSLQDTGFAFQVKNLPITALSAVRSLQVANNVLLTLGSFYASMQGVTGHSKAQDETYGHMILWGELSLGLGLGISLLSIFAAWKAKKKIENHETDSDASAIAYVRFSMDKDTLWHLIGRLKQMDPEDQQKIAEAMEIVKNNIDTQLKVTLGGHLALIVVGDVLQAIEKYFTPNSIEAAIINCGVSVAYATKICVQKGIEYRQRLQLDHLDVDRAEV